MSKALTVRQPWAWAIIYGGKDIENRTWTTSFRGRIWIHAGSAIDTDISPSGRDPRDVMNRAGSAAVRSAIIGSVEIVDVVQGHPSSWAGHEPGMYNWVLANPRPLDRPVSAAGKLNLWTHGPELGLPAP